MRNQNVLVAFLFFTYHLPANADGISSTTNVATGNASATVVAPVTLVKTADLFFGSIVPTFSPGTITVDPTGGRIGSNVVLSAANLGNPASFYLTGNPGARFSINLPSSITLTGPGNAMQLTTFTSSPASTGSFNTSGNATINIGGTLTVGANQAAGVYSGSFSITVDYY